MAFALGHVSGCHLNPAVSIGLVLSGRFPVSRLLPYTLAQLAGGVAGAAMLYFIASGKAGFSTAGGFASTGYGEHSPGGYSLLSGFVAEVVFTFIFMIIILGSTDKRALPGFAPIAIGLGLALILMVLIPVTNASLNPARSTATAVFVGGWAIAQLWMFWVAPILGAAAGGVAYRMISAEPKD